MGVASDPAELLGDRRPASELRAMDEQTARTELAIDELQRWRKVNDVHDAAAATRSEWADQEQAVTDIVVTADIEDLGTHVDIYGNDLLVRLDAEDADLRAEAQYLEDEYGDTAADEVPDMDDATIDDIAESFLVMLDRVIRRWDGTPWRPLREGKRERILRDAREAWGIDGLLLAWGDIVAAVEADREERVDVIDGFQS